jgi:hypothetical protein
MSCDEHSSPPRVTAIRHRVVTSSFRNLPLILSVVPFVAFDGTSKTETGTKERLVMTIRKLILATAMIAAGTGFALAQSAPAPANSSGPSVSPTTPAPTDPSAAGQSGDTKGTPSRGTMKSGSGTTGMGGSTGATTPTPGTNAKETQEKNASPASPAEGVKKEK